MGRAEAMSPAVGILLRTRCMRRVRGGRKNWCLTPVFRPPALAACPEESHGSENRCLEDVKNRRGDRVWPNSLICLRIAGWCFVRNTAVRIALVGQYGDRRNISAQLRRENISSVPALQIVHLALQPDSILSQFPDGSRKCLVSPRRSPHCSAR